MRLILTIVTLVLMSLPAIAKVPAIAKNTPYHEARPRLLAMGYTPVKSKSANCWSFDDRCTRYPEAEFCSGTGNARCAFLWRSKAGELIEILTYGEEDPMFIQTIRCRANCRKSAVQ